MLEEDELREILEKLATTVDEYKQIGFDSDDESEDEEDHENDYWTHYQKQ